MKKIYLDNNATAPLSSAVVEYITIGHFPYVNPASLYQSGKQLNRKLEEAIISIKNQYEGADDLEIFFHSGASEGVSTFFNLAPHEVMVYFESDHPAVHAMAKINKKKGAIVIKLRLTSTGHFNEEELVSALASYKDKKIYLNYTFVHNETGIVWPLEKAKKLKEKLNCFIHVDCAQAVGKTENWNKLSSSLDMYTFSSHKLGGLKGVGFSLINKNFPFRPLIPGGGQQYGLRGGTLNSMGIMTTDLALKDIHIKQNFNASLLLRGKIETLFKKYLGERGFVVLNDELRAVNTSLLCFREEKGDFLQAKFDMFGIEVSFGSACSSGSIKGSQTMISLGLEEYANNIIRISFGVSDYNNEEKILTALEKVLKTI